MGFFPTDAIDQDEIGPNANGTYFKYIAADDKWIIIPGVDVYSETEVDDLFTAHEGVDNAHHEVFENVVEDTTPQLGGPLDLNDKAITHELVAAVSLVAGNLCYMNGVGKMAKADADAEATCDTLLAMCLDTISADATGTFLIFGKWTTSGLTAGVEYWVSETEGEITLTRPTTATHIVRHIGTSLSTTVLFFNPSHTYVEIVA